MLKFLKKLFVGQPPEESGVESRIPVQLKTLPAPPGRNRRVSTPVFQASAPDAAGHDHGSPQGARPGKAPRPHQGNAQGGSGAGAAQVIRVSLFAVVNALPEELKSRARPVDLINAEISVPLENILPQLSQGAIKITFGELRRAAPAVFTTQNDLDSSPVVLPLGEVLEKLNPALMFRRQAQKRVVVPDEIHSPFGDTGAGLGLSGGRGEAPPVAAAPAVSARSVTPEATAPASVPRKSPPAPTPRPAPTTNGRTPLGMAPATAPAGASTRSAPEGSGLKLVPNEPLAAAEVNPVAAPVAPTKEVLTANIPLSLVSEGWPDSLRQEISGLNIAGATIAMPADLLQNSLQRGKVAYPWKTLRGWLKPAVPGASAEHDDTVLELPLRLLAPLFLSRQRELAKSKQKVAIDETIPNLFFGFPQAEAAPSPNTPPVAASCAVTKPVDTNYYAQQDLEAAAPTDEGATLQTAPLSVEAGEAVLVEAAVKRSGPTGTTFVTRIATPNDIVSRAAEQAGVAGALIALPDGLMVAGKLPAEINGDTVAAFLPQIFCKVNQCTNELRMGELNNLNFTVGNVPWKIFRVNAIFFAAFGLPGQPLPTATLAALASELDHKKQ